MRMLISSSDTCEVETLHRSMDLAGVRCEIRKNPPAADRSGIAFYPELWLQNDEDYLAAVVILSSNRLQARV